MIAARACRWIAIALALAAIVDPRVPLPQRERPGVRVLDGADSSSARALRERLREEGFTTGTQAVAATIAPRDARIDVSGGLPSAPLYALAGTGGTPNVSIDHALASASRVPGQAVAIAVTLRSRGAVGATTELRLEDAGLTVASATHRWTSDGESWRTTLTYLPAGTEASALRVRALAVPGERDTDDNVADVLAPPLRGPVRALVFEPAATWPGVFVRRALEADPGFAVASVQRITNNAATRAGAPPAALTREQLAPYEVLLCGTAAFDNSTRGVVRWFVEERGGIAVLVPDRPPARDAALLPGVAFDSRVMYTPDAPVALAAAQGGLTASEIALPRALPPLAVTLAADPAGAPVVFAVRRGPGAVLVSGALDAWRYRDRGEGAFARFWTSAVLAEAVAVPPRLDVRVTPAIVRPGEAVRVTARLRPSEVPDGPREIALPPASARAIAPSARIDEAIRLWPSSQPGVYEGEWRAPAAATYAIDVTMGSLSGAAVMKADPHVAALRSSDDERVIAARASGGEVFADGDSLVRALAARFPPATVFVARQPARSPWWAAAFAALLCAEWAVRRRKGLS